MRISFKVGVEAVVDVVLASTVADSGAQRIGVSADQLRVSRTAA